MSKPENIQRADLVSRVSQHSGQPASVLNDWEPGAPAECLGEAAR